MVDDKASKDPLQKKIAGIAVPGVAVNIFSVDKFLEIIKKTKIKKSTMLLFSTPISLLKVMNAGYKFEYVNVSGMRFSPGRERIIKNVSATEKEVYAFEKIMELGAEVYAQTTTRDDKINLRVLLDKYQKEKRLKYESNN